VAHHFRVRLHGRVGIEIAGLEGAKPKPIRNDRRNFECRHLAASTDAVHRPEYIAVEPPK
jgi:hypothetical protein